MSRSNLSASKWIIVALLLGSSPALAQGTGQTIMPPAPGASSSPPQPIGNPGGPVATGRFNPSSTYSSEAGRRNVITAPRH